MSEEGLETRRPVSGRGRRVWAAVAAAVLAAGTAWGLSEATLDRVRGKDVAQTPMAGGASLADINRIVVKRATLMYGLQGAALGLMLGLAGAAARRSVSAAALGGPVGLVAGAAAGTGGARGLFRAYFSLADLSEENMLLALLCHAGVWGLIGLAGGLAYGLGVGGGGGRVARAAVGGLIGAVLATVLYEVIGAAAFPLDKTAEPVAATGAARLLGIAAVALFTALGAALSAESRSAKVPA